MKTTSYDISKKLWEIGFKKNTIFGWDDKDKPSMFSNGVPYSIIESDKIIIKSNVWFPAYDLETILEALPEFNRQSYILTKGGIAYLPPVEEGQLQQKGESLADCAAKLLLKLHEKGLVKFNN